MTVILLAAIGLVGLEIYEVWQKQTQVFDTVGAAFETREAKATLSLSETRAAPRVGTRTIVARNLFDPDRGAKAEEPPEPPKVEEEPAQSIEGLLLLGTVIAGSERYAIMQVPPEAAVVPTSRRRTRRVAAKRPPVPAGSGVRRVRVGDSLRGYEVKDIGEQRVVLGRGDEQTELTIDYTREVVAPKKTQVKKTTRKSPQRTNRSRRVRNRRKANPAAR